MPSVQPLTGRTIEKKVKSAQAERIQKLSDVDAEIERMKARMRERKEAQETRSMEAVPTAPEDPLVAAALAGPAVLGVYDDNRPADNSGSDQRKLQTQQKGPTKAATEEPLEELVVDEALLKALSPPKAVDKPIAEGENSSPGAAAATPAEEQGGGLFGGLFDNLLSAVQPAFLKPESEEGKQEKREAELKELKEKCKAQHKVVTKLRATGGIPLAEAAAELKEMQRAYKALEAQYKQAAERLGISVKGDLQKADGISSSGPVKGSAASQNSARRQARAKARMEARGGGMVF
jgi:hypothetical protein